MPRIVAVGARDSSSFTMPPFARSCHSGRVINTTSWTMTERSTDASREPSSGSWRMNRPTRAAVAAPVSAARAILTA